MVAVVAAAAPWGDFRGGALDKTRLRGSAHEFVVDLRCGRYAAALGRFLSLFLDLRGPQRDRDFVSEGQSCAAGPNQSSLQAQPALLLAT